jgi:hypothetical protein
MEEGMKSTVVFAGRESKIGQVAAWLSMLCVVHCILEPVVLPLLPLAGIVLNINKSFELGLIVASLALALWNIGNGFPKHGAYGPAMLLCLSTIIFFATHAGWIPCPKSDTWNSIPVATGALTLAIGQFWNRRILKNTKACRHHSCEHSVKND